MTALYEIRIARVGEGEGLTSLCMRSKAYWGYDASFMAQCVDALIVGEPAIADGRVLIAEESDHVVGVGAVAEEAPGIFDLTHLFIEPAAIGTGIGAALFTALVALVRKRNGRSLTILSDPQARQFYERMGARFDRMAPSDAIPGRELPFLVYALEAMV